MCSVICNGLMVFLFAFFLFEKRIKQSVQGIDRGPKGHPDSLLDKHYSIVRYKALNGVNFNKKVACG